MTEKNKLGEIQSVDTATVNIEIDDEEILNTLQVNQLLWIRSSNAGQKIIALVSKIMRKLVDNIEEESENIETNNIVKAYMIGTWLNAEGTEKNVFKRTLETVPSLGADSFVLEKEDLTNFMSSISSKNQETNLEIGQ